MKMKDESIHPGSGPGSKVWKPRQWKPFWMNEKTGTINCNCNNLHLLKKLDYKEFMPSFCGVLLGLLLVFMPFIIFEPIDSGWYQHPRLVEVKNFQYEPFEYIPMTITLDNQGKIWLDGSLLTDTSPSSLEGILKERIEERKLFGRRALLRADKDVEFFVLVENRPPAQTRSPS